MDQAADLEDSCTGHYLSKIADLVTCCFPAQEGAHAAKRQKIEAGNVPPEMSSKVIGKRHAAVPCAFHNR